MIFPFTFSDPYFLSQLAGADPVFIEDFEFPWDGTIEDPLYYLSFTFGPAWVEDFDTGW